MTVRALLTDLFGTVGGLPAIERHAHNLTSRWEALAERYDVPTLDDMEGRGWIVRRTNRAVLTYEKGRLARIELDSLAFPQPAKNQQRKPKSSGAELLLQLNE